MSDNEDMIAKEEARIMKELESASQRAKVTFGGRKSHVRTEPAVPSGAALTQQLKQQQVKQHQQQQQQQQPTVVNTLSPVITASGVSQHTRRSSLQITKPVQNAAVQAVQAQQASGHQRRASTNYGEVPAWKKQQMEAQAREKAKQEAEEKAKQEKLKNISSGVDTEPVISLSGAPTPTPSYAITPEPPVESTVDTTPLSPPKPMSTEELEELARKEEERMIKKTSSVVPGIRRNDHAQKQKEQQEGFGKKVTIAWFDRTTNEVVRKEGFYVRKERLPMRSIMDLWGVKTMTMKDTGSKIGVMLDGYSDVSFEGITTIHVYCDQ